MRRIVLNALRLAHEAALSDPRSVAPKPPKVLLIHGEKSAGKSSIAKSAVRLFAAMQGTTEIEPVLVTAHGSMTTNEVGQLFLDNPKRWLWLNRPERLTPDATAHLLEMIRHPSNTQFVVLEVEQAHWVTLRTGFGIDREIVPDLTLRREDIAPLLAYFLTNQKLSWTGELEEPAREFSGSADQLLNIVSQLAAKCGTLKPLSIQQIAAALKQTDAEPPATGNDALVEIPESGVLEIHLETAKGIAIAKHGSKASPPFRVGPANNSWKLLCYKLANHNTHDAYVKMSAVPGIANASSALEELRKKAVKLRFWSTFLQKPSDIGSRQPSLVLHSLTDRKVKLNVIDAPSTPTATRV